MANRMSLPLADPLDPVDLIEAGIADAGGNVRALVELRAELDRFEHDCNRVVVTNLVDEDDRDERQAVLDWWLLWREQLAAAHELLGAQLREVTRDRRR